MRHPPPERAMQWIAFCTSCHPPPPACIRAAPAREAEVRYGSIPHRSDRSGSAWPSSRPQAIRSRARFVHMHCSNHNTNLCNKHSQTDSNRFHAPWFSTGCRRSCPRCHSPIVPYAWPCVDVICGNDAPPLRPMVLPRLGFRNSIGYR